MASNPQPERYRDWLPLHISLLSSYRGRPGVLSSRYVPTGLTAWLIYRGSAEVIIGSEKTRATAGQWLFPRPVARLQRFSENIELLSLNFYAQWPTGEPLFSEGLGLVVRADSHPALELKAIAIEHQFERLVPNHDYTVFTQAMPFSGYMEVQRQFGEFFSAYVQTLESCGIRPRLPGKVDPRLQSAIDAVGRVPTSRPLRVREISRSAGLSAVQLNRLAVQHLGHTLREHHERRRAEYARRCLVSPGTQVKQVAIELGFTSLGHFSRWFNSIHGISPREFKRRGRESWL